MQKIQSLNEIDIERRACDQHEICKIHSARSFVYNIYVRARQNAFAHRVAAEAAGSKGDSITRANLIATSAALACVTLQLYFQSDEELKVLAFIMGYIAIISSMIALYTQCVALNKKFDQIQVRHELFQGSFQYIAQRAREIDRPGFKIERIDGLIDELERQFSLLKAKAPEPTDEHFEAAGELLKKIRSDPKYSTAISFANIDTSSQESQHKRCLECPFNR